MELYHVCKYSIPSFLDIGKLYSILIEDCAKPGDEVSELMKIFSSFISDEISNLIPIYIIKIQTILSGHIERENC